MSSGKSQSTENITKVDSHQHFWQLSRGDYSWLTPELEKLYQDFLPKQLAPELIQSNVVQTMLIQAEESENEINFMLGIAEVIEYVGGVVGWIDIEASNALEKLEHYSENMYFKGIRPMLQNIDDVNWVLRDEFSPIFHFMEQKNLTFDALIKDIHLSNIHTLAQRHPKLKIVIDHCAKPNLSKSPSDFWKNRLESIATCKNIYIKFSGLLTEAPQGQVDIEVIQPYFDHLFSVFGPDRMMWGSDWPVVNLNGDYDTWVSITNSLLKDCSYQDKQKIWADNSKKFYSLSV